MIGILAYGSLITDPGAEIKSATLEVKENVQTPFEVEYARKSRGRAYAPTLVPVGLWQGSPVQASIILLKPGITEHQAVDMLYRRERDKVGDARISYAPPIHITADTVLVEKIANFAGVETVIYTWIGANLPEILDPEIDMQKKARILAFLAVESLTQETYDRQRDGIQYLMNNIASGVVTPLTRLYESAILAIAQGATDLLNARTMVARNQGISIEQKT